MTDHKFTDEEVVKALEWCSQLRLCVDCPLRSKGYFSHSGNACRNALMKNALDLINRQKAEIERLQVELDDLKRDAIPKLQWSLQRANAMGRELEVELEAMRCAAMKETELKPCPRCGEVPEIGYCCGEYFVFHPSKIVGMCVCSSFTEMHSSEQQEIEAWNRRVENETD